MIIIEEGKSYYAAIRLDAIPSDVMAVEISPEVLKHMDKAALIVLDEVAELIIEMIDSELSDRDKGGGK